MNPKTIDRIVGWTRFHVPSLNPEKVQVEASQGTATAIRFSPSGLDFTWLFILDHGDWYTLLEQEGGKLTRQDFQLSPLMDETNIFPIYICGRFAGIAAKDDPQNKAARNTFSECTKAIRKLAHPSLLSLAKNNYYDFGDDYHLQNFCDKSVALQYLRALEEM